MPYMQDNPQTTETLVKSRSTLKQQKLWCNWHQSFCCLRIDLDFCWPDLYVTSETTMTQMSMTQKFLLLENWPRFLSALKQQKHVFNMFPPLPLYLQDNHIQQKSLLTENIFYWKFKFGTNKHRIRKFGGWFYNDLEPRSKPKAVLQWFTRAWPVSRYYTHS